MPTLHEEDVMKAGGPHCRSCWIAANEKSRWFFECPAIPKPVRVERMRLRGLGMKVRQIEEQES